MIDDKKIESAKEKIYEDKFLGCGEMVEAFKDEDEKEIESISIGKPKKGLCPDKWLDTEFFIIKFK